MKKLTQDVKGVTKGLRALTKKTEAIAKKVDKLEKARAAKKPRAKTKAKAKTAKRAPAKKVTARKKVAARKKAAKLTATDQVIKILKRSKKGLDAPTLIKKTGFGERSVRNILYKASKARKIKRTGRGVYVAA
jgi:hypothetical protein